MMNSIIFANFANMKGLFYYIALMCVVLIQTSGNAHRHTSTLSNNIDESEIFSDPEQQPYYINGGDKGLLNDLYTTLFKTTSVTQDSIKSRAVVSFKISEDGQLDSNSIKVVRNKSVPDDYLKAAIEAIKNLGKFEPGKMNGTPIRVTLYLHILYPIPIEHIKTSE